MKNPYVKLPCLYILCFFINYFQLVCQCAQITKSNITPNCTPNCILCSGDKLTISLEGSDLPQNGKIDYYADINSGFNPYKGQGTKIGTANISTTNPKCRICPELLGFMIDACGSEAKNEFLMIWTGSGFNTADFNFDYAFQNNIFGAADADIGPGGCGITNGNPGLVGGCNALPVGSKYNLPPNAIWIVFTSVTATTNYDFSSVCGLACKIFVSSSTCDRVIGAFSNFDASPGLRSQTMTISGCNCSENAVYIIPGSMTGQGDFWAEGNIENNGCATPSLNAPNYTPALSTVDPFTYYITPNWCDKKYEIVGILNPKPDVNCCVEEFTDRFSAFVNCPKANPTILEMCETNNGQSEFNLENASADILANANGMVEYFKDPLGTRKINSPFTSGSTTIYAQIIDGNCRSGLVPVNLNVLLLPIAKSTSEEICDDYSGSVDFDLSSLELVIKNGINTTNVQFFKDQNKILPISSPFKSNSTIVYATISDSRCESKPVGIPLTVLKKPEAYDTSVSSCPEADGRATFILSDYISKITNKQSNVKINFFEDDALVNEIHSPYKTGTDTIYAIVSNSKCKSDPVEVILKVDHLNPPPLIYDKNCADENGKATFDLVNVTKILQQSDTSIHIQWFEDRLQKSKLLLPVIVSSIDTIYAILSKDSCVSNYVTIILESVKRPVAKSFVWNVCSKTGDPFDFDLKTIVDSINQSNGLNVVFSKDSLLTKLVKDEYQCITDTLYAATIDGSCFSNPVKIILNVHKVPLFTKLADSIVCDYFILPPIHGMNLTSNASYYHSIGNNGIKWNAGDTIWQTSLIYLNDRFEECEVQDSLYIEIIQHSDAGKDHSISVCDYSIINLFNYISDANRGGTFYDLEHSGNLIDSFFHPMAQAGQIFRMAYVLKGNPNCPADTTIISVHIVKELFAGRDTDITICQNEIIDLFSLIPNADLGGRFIDIFKSNALNSRMWDANKAGPGYYKIIYEIGDSIICPIKDAVIKIRVNPSIEINIDSVKNHMTCDYYILPTITGKNTSGRTFYYAMSGGKGIKFNEGDTIRNDIPIYIFAKDTGYCESEDSFTIKIIQSTSSDFIRKNLCPNETFTIGNNKYDKNNPKGKEFIKALNQFACDSIINVDLQFLPTANSTYFTSLCKGEKTLINGHTYDQSNIFGVDTLKNAASNGCDSFVVIIIKLLFPNQFTYRNQICNNDSVVIGDLIFNKNNSQLIDTLKGLSENGCDSIRNIQIQFYQEAVGNFSETLCENQYVLINGNRYDKNKSSGQDILKTASAKGCDSIVNVVLYFTPNDSTIYRNLLCPEEFIVINGTIYNLQHPSGTEHYFSSSSCDSIVTIDLHFPVINISYTKDVFLAPGKSKALNINSSFKPLLISWSPSANLSCTDCMNPIANPASSTTYTVTLSDENGCSIAASIAIHIQIDDNVFIPNAFSPNGDNINDFFKIISENQDVFISDFVIYDRWGNLIYYESNKPITQHKGWDGNTTFGEKLNPGVYVYYIKLKIPGAEDKILYGDVSLMR